MNITLRDEGLDIPSANVVIIVSGTGSRRQLIQRIGRLLRPEAKGQTSILYEIIVKRAPEELQATRRRTPNLGEF